MNKDEAIQVIRSNYPTGRHQLCEALETLIPELKESKDERVKKALIHYFSEQDGILTAINGSVSVGDILAWLEKQGEQKPDTKCLLSWSETDEKMLQNLEGIVKDYWAKAEQEKNEIKIREASNVSYFLKTIQKSPLCWIKCSDGLPNRDGTYLVVTDGRHNDVYDMARYDSIEGWHKASEIIYWMPIPQLNNKSIIEQKPTDKVEPKFKIGDWITIDNPCQIISIDGNYIVQYCDDETTREISKKFCESQFHTWTIQDAKDGDVISFNDGHGNDCIELIKSITGKKIEFWFCLTNGNCYEVFDGIIPYTNFASRKDATPATKEQRDLLFSKMKEAGYEWDAEKKELKKMKQKTTKLPNGEDYGIDSLYHAARILEKTLGEVEGYQSDDGILEHKCAIEAVNRLYKQKPAKWSDEDEKQARQIERIVHNDGCTQKLQKQIADWFKSLKERVQSQSN